MLFVDLEDIRSYVIMLDVFSWQLFSQEVKTIMLIGIIVRWVPRFLAVCLCEVFEYVWFVGCDAVNAFFHVFCGFFSRVYGPYDNF